MASNEYFVFIDVTSYVEYLTGSELEHTSDLLRNHVTATHRSLETFEWKL